MIFQEWKDKERTIIRAGFIRALQALPMGGALFNEVAALSLP